jgi:hypothetical protein
MGRAPRTIGYERHAQLMRRIDRSDGTGAAGSGDAANVGRQVGSVIQKYPRIRTSLSIGVSLFGIQIPYVGVSISPPTVYSGVLASDVRVDSLALPEKQDLVDIGRGRAQW